MKISSKELVDAFSDLVRDTQGQHQEFDHTACPQTSNENSLIFLYKAQDAPAQAAIVVTCEEALAEIDMPHSFVVLVDNVRLAQALIKQHFDDYQARDEEWDAIHPSAVVHESASLGRGCRVGPNAVIGRDCVLGENVIVRAGAIIEHGVAIGDDSIINAQVNIGYNCQLGARVTVQSGCVIGSEGFGFAPDSDNRYHRIPHTGNVVLADDVHVGANTCIDRGTYGSTLLARGVKIDNLVHIAHNVEIGEDTLITAQSVIAGSSKIGKRVIASGQTGILDHKTVADDAVLVQRCGVSEDIPSGGMWAGSPARPFKEFVRNLALGKKVAKLEQQLKDLKSQLDQS